jgi:hypothetical protein
MQPNQPAFLWEVLIPAGMVIAAMMMLLRWLGAGANISPEAMIGVKPSPRPFETRAEFLKARMDMDLEEFLERARITSEELKRVTGPSGCSAPVGPSGYSGIPEISGQPGGFSGFSGYPGRDPGFSGISGFSGFAIRPVSVQGHYFRTKLLGILVYVSRVITQRPVIWRTIEADGRVVFRRPEELEAAYPMPGEVWSSGNCPKHWGCPTIRFPEGGCILSPAIKEKVECGCFAPCNFGKG